VRLIKARYAWRDYVTLFYILGVTLFVQINVCFLQVEKNKGEKGGFGPSQALGSGKIENSLSDLSISSSGTAFGSGSGLGFSSDVDSFPTKSKGLVFMDFHEIF